MDMPADAAILPPPSLPAFSLDAAPPGLGEEAGSKMVLAISAVLSSTAAVAFQVKDEGRRTASGEGLEVPVACGLSGPASQDVSKANETGAVSHAQGVPALAAASDMQVGAWMLVQVPGDARAAADAEVEMAVTAKREVTEKELATLGAFAHAGCGGEQSAVVQSPRTPRDCGSLGCESSSLPPARAVNPGGEQGATEGAVAGVRHDRIEMLARRSCARGINPPRTPDGQPLPKGRTQAMEAGARSKGKRVALRALQLDSVSGLSPGPRPLISL